MTQLKSTPNDDSSMEIISALPVFPPRIAIRLADQEGSKCTQTDYTPPTNNVAIPADLSGVTRETAIDVEHSLVSQSEFRKSHTQR